MKGLYVLGVTQISDSYPNVKYKLVALKEILGADYAEFVVPIDNANSSPGIFSALGSGRPAFIWRFILAHIKVLLHSLRHRAKSVYVCYPGIFIVLWLSLPLIRRRYPVVYLDAFISLYDTVVFDRALLKESSIFAKLLYRLEKGAFAAATIVIVDTPENARHYSQLFDLPQPGFLPMPLSIPPLLPSETIAASTAGRRFRCVFVGTFVPLQGIGTIVEAAKLLTDEQEIDFVIVGDGQEAHILEDYLANYAQPNITWHRGHFSTEFVIEQICSADICLGIFGQSQKAQRVLPLKIYYYLALGRPVITAVTETTDRLLAECEGPDNHPPLLVVPPGDARSLAHALRRLRGNPAELMKAREAGADYYRRILADAAIRQSLRQLLDID